MSQHCTANNFNSPMAAASLYVPLSSNRTGMLQPPTKLFQPAIVSKVVRQTITRKQPKREIRRNTRNEMIFDTGGD